MKYLRRVMRSALPHRSPAKAAARVLSGIVWCAALLVAESASARSAGVAASGCDNCHSGGKAPTVTLTADPPNAAVGQAITLTIGVSQANGSSAGFYLTTAFNSPGAFTAVESGTAWSGSGVLHTAPRIGSGGITTFKAQWTASQATGVDFDVYALSANGDETNRGDGAATAHLQVAVGCSGATYYIDQDSDGYGSTDPVYVTRVDCSAPPGYAAVSGDCDDFRAQVHPGALEQCDMRDNDCNGAVDDDVVNQAFCQDQDGDSHGVPGAATKMDCKPSAGFGDCDGDCDDRDADTHPGASEVCDGRDNDCDGKVDEGARGVCGVGLCARYANGCSDNCTPGEPFAETCDGFDDDCDGEVDEGTNEALCGDANVSCVSGHCQGEPSGAPVSGSGAGSTAGSGSGGSATSAPWPGLTPDSSAGNGCAFSPARRDVDLCWLPLAAVFVRRLRRSRSKRA